MICPEISWVGGVERGIRHQPDAGNLTAQSRNGVVEAVTSVEKKNIWRPDDVGESGRGVRRPVRRVRKNVTAFRPKNFVRRRFPTDVLAGVKNVILVFALDDAAGIVRAQAAAQRWCLETRKNGLPAKQPREQCAGKHPLKTGNHFCHRCDVIFN